MAETDLESQELAVTEASDRLREAEVDQTNKPAAGRDCRNWLTGYVDFTSQWEPPNIFNKWVGLLVLSAACQRRVWLADGNSNIFPNLFVILVAPSGVGKTSAMREAVPFIEAAGVPISPAKITAAKLVKTLSEVGTHHEDLGILTPYVVWAEELPSFLGSDAYKSGMLADLTALYDCPESWTKETKNKGVDSIPAPYICIMAGATAQGIFDVLPPGAISQGFTARLIFVHASYNQKRVPEKPWTSVHTELKEALTHDIQQIAKLKGPAHFTDLAKTLWVDYYMHRPAPQDEFGDVRLQGYSARKPFYIKKLALLLSLAERNDLVVDASHVEQAKQLLEELDKSLKEVYEEIAPNTIVQHYSKIVKKIKSLGGRVQHSVLMRFFAYTLDGREFEMAMKALVDMGAVEIDQEKSTSGRYIRIYQLTKLGAKW